jgi:hypothetical protein
MDDIGVVAIERRQDVADLDRVHDRDLDAVAVFAGSELRLDVVEFSIESQPLRRAFGGACKEQDRDLIRSLGADDGDLLLEFCGPFSQHNDLATLSGLQRAASPLFSFAVAAGLGFGALLPVRFTLAGVHVLLTGTGGGIVGLAFISVDLCLAVGNGLRRLRSSIAGATSCRPLTICLRLLALGGRRGARKQRA